MEIAIIGAGRLASVLSRAWVRAGHTITFGVRNQSDPKVVAILSECGLNTTAIASPTEAVSRSSIVVPAVPWSAFEATIGQLGDLTNKILIDCSSPFKAWDRSAPSFREELAYGYDTSGAEHVAVWAPSARVVLAFNAPGLEVLADPTFGSDRATMFICGDDVEAKEIVTQLAGDVGFDVCDVGPLRTARYVEPMAMVWIDMARNQKRGSDFAFKLLRRKTGLLPPCDSAVRAGLAPAVNLGGGM